MEVFALNATVGIEGLCPILLVFGALQRPARTFQISQVDSARVLDFAMYEAEREQTKRRLNYGLKHPAGPNAKEAYFKKYQQEHHPLILAR